MNLTDEDIYLATCGCIYNHKDDEIIGLCDEFSIKLENYHLSKDEKISYDIALHLENVVKEYEIRNKLKNIDK